MMLEDLLSHENPNYVIMRKRMSTVTHGWLKNHTTVVPDLCLLKTMLHNQQNGYLIIFGDGVKTVLMTTTLTSMVLLQTMEKSQQEKSTGPVSTGNVLWNLILRGNIDRKEAMTSLATSRSMVFASFLSTLLRRMRCRSTLPVETGSTEGQTPQA